MRRFLLRSSRILSRSCFTVQPSSYNIQHSSYNIQPLLQPLVTPQMRFYSQDGGDNIGFIRTFLNKFREGIEEDESFQKDIDELDSTTTAKVLKETADVTKEGSKWLYDQTEPIREEVQKTADMTAEGIYQTVEIIGKGVDKIGESIVIRKMIEELNREYEMMRTAHFSFRSAYAREKDAEDGIYYNPYSKQFEEIGDHEVDEETGTVVIVDDPTLDPTQEEGELVPQGAFGMLRGGMSAIGDKIFRPTAQSEALERIRKRNPEFNMDLFVGNVENILIPVVLDGYFEDDKEGLKRVLSERGYRERIWPLIQERKEKEIQFDTRIIKLSGVSFEKAAFIEKEPVIQIIYQLQHIHCLKDLDGNIVEGGLTDIRMGGHMMSLMQDPSKETNDWEIAEWIFGQTLKIPA